MQLPVAVFPSARLVRHVPLPAATRNHAATPFTCRSCCRRCQTCPAWPVWWRSREPAGWAARPWAAAGRDIPAGRPAGGDEAQKLGDEACGIGQRLGRGSTRGEGSSGAFLISASPPAPADAASPTAGPCQSCSSAGASSVPRTSDEGCCPRSQVYFIMLSRKRNPFP